MFKLSTERIETFKYNNDIQKGKAQNPELRPTPIIKSFQYVLNKRKSSQHQLAEM